MTRLIRAILPFAFVALLKGADPHFEPNIGQAAQDILFLSRVGTTAAYVEDRAVEFQIASAHAVRLSWVAASAAKSTSSNWVLSNPTGDTKFYCNQPNVDLCRQAVPSYAQLTRTALYPNLDWALHGSGPNLEYDLIVHPGGKLADAKFRIEGATARLDRDGTLHAGKILQWRPVAYQMIDGKKIPVKSSLRQLGNGDFQFTAGQHRKDLDLIVDPVIQPLAVVGGNDDDILVGSASNNSCSFRYGITKSSEWSRLPANSTAIFAQLTKNGQGTKTIYWGGSGDSRIGGSDTDLNNCTLDLVGWTSAQDAPVIPGGYGTPIAHSYAGGATDGFFLQIGWDGLSFASYIGGPGADRVYDLRITASSGSTGTLLLVGETDDPAWPGATVQKIGVGGQSDAFAASILGEQVTLVTIGGSGNDRAIRLRKADTGFYAIAGETDSPDFPLTAGDAPPAAKNLWLGRISTDLATLPVLRVFGGSNDEQFGGLAVAATRGIFLAGTTNSTDLPAATGTFQGGPTDGFLTAFDPLTLAPLATTYIGGSGQDAIASLESNGYELYLGGSTDSPDLTLPGLAPGDSVYGSLDALFVIADFFGSPTRGTRFGGSADDRIVGIEPVAFGQVNLSGTSQSLDWLQRLDPFAVGLGGLDGFQVSLSFADLRLTPSFGATVKGDVYIGRDLQSYVGVTAVSEAGMDGIVLVTTSDPSKLLIAADSRLPGTDRLLLKTADNSNQIGFYLHALADSGTVDIFVEGRPGAASKGIYPKQRLRVQLTPTALFVTSPKEVTVAPKYNVDVTFIQAPVFPDGTPGTSFFTIPNVTATPWLASSDPSALPVPPSSVYSPNAGTFRISAIANSLGDYTLTPTSTRFSPAPGQAVTVHVKATTNTVFSSRDFVLAKDNASYIYLSGAPGDTLRFTSEDPSRLQLGKASSSFAEAINFTFASGTQSQVLWVAGLASDGVVNLRAEGTYRGQPIVETIQIHLVGYKAILGTVYTPLAVGRPLYVNVNLVPQIPPELAKLSYLPANLNPSIASSLRFQPSDRTVLTQGGISSNPLIFSFLGAQPGTVTLSFNADAPLEFLGLTAKVEVVKQSIDFGGSSLRIPVGVQKLIYPGFFTQGIDALKSVRLRLSPGAPFTLQYNSQIGNDITVNFAQQYYAAINAPNATVGQTATMFVSAPGIDEFPIELRAIESVYAPNYQELRLPAGQPQGSAYFVLHGYDNGRVLTEGPYRLLNTLSFHPTVTPAGICTVPPTVDVSQVGEVFVTATCSGPGAVFVSLQPSEGITAAQPQFTVRVVSKPTPSLPLPIYPRVFTGIGVQFEVSLYSLDGNNSPFTGTLTSTDPDRVRLSFDRRGSGSASLTVPANGSGGSVFIQGYASDGIVPITVQTADGRTGELTVYLFPTTMTVRPGSISEGTDSSALLTRDQPLSAPDLTLVVRPYLVEPSSQKLLWSNSLSIRGDADPVFVRAQTSDAAVAQTVLPDALVSGGDFGGYLKFRMKASGDVILSASQPEGFVSVPDSALRVHSFQHALTFTFTPILSADLQTIGFIAQLDSNSANVTATSLDPSKLLVSTSATTVGKESVTFSTSSQQLYLQALSGVLPGAKLSVRLESPGYETSLNDVIIAPAELQLQDRSATQFTFDPLQKNAGVSLLYGPLDFQGRVSFNGSVRPGANLSLQVSSSDPTIFSVTQPTVPIKTSLAVNFQTLAPGFAKLLIQASEQVTNRVPSLFVTVGLYKFQSSQVDPPIRYLTSNFTVPNPRPVPTAVTVSTTGAVPVRFGTSPSFTATLNPNQIGTFSLEPVGPGNRFNLQVAATDFETYSNSFDVADPTVTFLQTGNMNLKAAGANTPLTLVLRGYGANREAPLGSSYGPLPIQVLSSNPKVVAIATSPLIFNPGDSRKDATLQIVGTGDAIVSLIVPPAFAGSAPTRQDIQVSVR